MVIYCHLKELIKRTNMGFFASLQLNMQIYLGILVNYAVDHNKQYSKF